ncbi:MAG TPA: hypothetical protein VJV79_33460 [Polyangiaceae bacterium]|nr:hypothetical protein [Polyangiaceae bacterium]
MSGESESTAAGRAARWPGVLAAVGLFLLVWLSCWYYKAALVSWVAQPLVKAWPPELMGSSNLVYRGPNGLFAGYVWVCTAPALVTSVPLLTRTLMFRQRVPTLAFIGLSYAATALSFVYVRFCLTPPMLQWMVSTARAWHSSGFGSVGYPLLDYLRLVTSVFAVQAIGAQLAVVLLFSTIAERGRGQTRRRAALQLLGLSGAALLAGVLLTTPDLWSHFLFLLPLIALYALATLAGRVFGKSSTAALVTSTT